MIELFLTAITQPPEVLLNTFVSLFVSFFMIPSSKGHSVIAYLDTIYMTLVFNKIRKTQNEHRLSKFDRSVS